MARLTDTKKALAQKKLVGFVMTDQEAQTETAVKVGAAKTGAAKIGAQKFGTAKLGVIKGVTPKMSLTKDQA